MWARGFKNGASKICGRQPLTNLTGYDSSRPFCILQKRCFERQLLNLAPFLFSNPISFYGHYYETKKEPGTTNYLPILML